MKGLLVLIVALFLIVGCGTQAPETSGPTPTPTPTLTAEVFVRPGAFCAPRGGRGKAADRTPMVCVGTPQPRWRMEVRSS